MADRLANGLTPHKDMKMEMRAIREGWPISPERKQEILENICRIAAGKPIPGSKEAVTHSTAVKAFNALVMANRPALQQNIQVNNYSPQEVQEDLLDDNIAEGMLVHKEDD